MNWLLYVSVRKAFSSRGRVDIDDIISVSRSRNADLDVTGALVATPTHYAQMLEGPESALVTLMASIDCDERHSHVNLLYFAPQPHRELARWSLAYSGESTYVSDMIAAAIHAPHVELRAYAEQIRALMLLLA